MPFIIIILLRVLFIASMVFVVGYVFGGFSKRPALVTVTKVAVIFSIVLFMSTTALSFRFGGWRHRQGEQPACGWHQQETVGVQQGK